VVKNEKNKQGIVMKRVFINIGKIFFVFDVLSIISLILCSVITRGKVDYGGRCYVEYNFEKVKEYSFEGIELIEEELKCNTYVISYKSKLTKEGNILFLNDISRLLYEENIDNDVNINIVSLNHQIIASIVDYKINYVISEI
jgi:hypothetical protein